MTGPLQQLFARLLATRQAEELAPDPRNARVQREPPFYSDYARFYSTPVDRTAPPPMAFRRAEQEGPAPPLGRLEMAFRNRK